MQTRWNRRSGKNRWHRKHKWHKKHKPVQNESKKDTVPENESDNYDDDEGDDEDEDDTDEGGKGSGNDEELHQGHEWVEGYDSNHGHYYYFNVGRLPSFSVAKLLKSHRLLHFYFDFLGAHKGIEVGSPPRVPTFS